MNAREAATKVLEQAVGPAKVLGIRKRGLATVYITRDVAVTVVAGQGPTLITNRSMK